MKRQINQILLIEDDEDQCDLVRFSIEEQKLPYQLDVAHTGRDGLEKISNNQYDVVFLDYRLPDLNGLEVLKRIRRLQEKTGDFSVIIFITGGGSEQVAVEAIRNGAFDYIVKSFDYQSLIPKILDDLESYYTEKFNLDEIHILVFKKGNTGPEVHTSTPNLPFRQSPGSVLPKIGVSLFFLVGMGESYNEGLFGPVPISDEEEFSALVFATFITDESLADERMKGRNYVLVCLVFPKSLVPFFSSRREDVESFFRKFTGQFADIKHLSDLALIELRKQFYAPLQQVRMELELSYRNKQLQKQKYENYIFSKKLSEKIVEISDKLIDTKSEDDKLQTINELNHIGSDSDLIVSLSNLDYDIQYEKINVTEFFESLIKKNGNKIKLNLKTNFADKKEISLETDRFLLEKLVSKLIFTGFQMNSTKLDIEMILEDENYLRLEFIANGLNIDKTQFPHFFEPFFIISDQLKVSNNLGLALVYEIVKTFHGRIWVEYSKLEKNGLTIITLLPIRKTV
ncbi:MAG: response regulator [Candidatus Hodarchaeales archaeon]|jgi:CheY-like chemotaxis protein/signal transduction histidine kinase